MEDLKIYFVTYNVGTSSPEDANFHPLLNLSENRTKCKNLADFYVIALQEVSAQPHNLLLDALNEDPWTRMFMEILGCWNYVKLKTIRLQGLVLSLFSLRQHLLNIHGLESEYTRTGFSGMWGNKGAVTIRLSIYGCYLCFVNAHLAAHDEQVGERIEDYNSIIEQQTFHVADTKLILHHDYVFWMGDLNFRLSEEYQKNPEEIERSVNKGDIDELFKHDQLRILMEKQEAFAEFKENQPRFPPTFKFEVGEGNVYDHKRRPAWTDRILYKVNTNNYNNVMLKAEQTLYTSHPTYCLSDHKPVSGEFVIKTKIHQVVETDSQVFADFGDEIVKFSPISPWSDSEENLIEYKFVKRHEVGSNDWIGVYRDNFNSLDDYEAYEYIAKNSSPTPVPKFNNASREATANLLKEEKGEGSGENAARVSDNDWSGKSYQIGFSVPSGNKIDFATTKYRLVYINETEDKVRSVLGISEPFIIINED